MNTDPERARDLGELTPLQARISKVMGEKLKRLAKQTGRRRAAVIREALEDWTGLPDPSATLTPQAAADEAAGRWPALSR